MGITQVRWKTIVIARLAVYLKLLRHKLERLAAVW